MAPDPGEVQSRLTPAVLSANVGPHRDEEDSALQKTLGGSQVQWCEPVLSGSTAGGISVIRSTSHAELWFCGLALRSAMNLINRQGRELPGAPGTGGPHVLGFLGNMMTVEASQLGPLGFSA